jgi:hypothetical protein
LSAVDQLSRRVEMAGVAGCFGDDMEQDVPHIVHVRFTEKVPGPPGQGSVRGRGGESDVGELCLGPIPVEYLGVRDVWAHLPGVIDVVQSFDDDRVAGDDGTEPESLDVRVRGAV